MEVLKKNIHIGFVLLLSLLFAYCSSDSVIDDKEADGDKGKASHTYDIKFTKGSEVIHYKGSISSKDFVSIHIEDPEGLPLGSKVVSYIINHNGISIITMLSLNANGTPYPFNEDAMEVGLGSMITIADSKTIPMIVSVSGTGGLKNFKTFKTLEPKSHLASYTHEFEGQFDVLKVGEDEPTRYSGKGKVVINPVNY